MQQTRGVTDGGSLLNAALERFRTSRLPRPDLDAVRDEVKALIEVLGEGNDFTTEEARRWRAASQVIRAAGGHSIP